MPVTLPVYRCFLISPSDVQAERDAIVAAVSSWNGHAGPSLHARIEVVRWESHARPEMGAPAQAIINEQLVDGCDFGVAVFWSRLGSPTEKHLSGSAEEVERLLERAAKVLAYFSTRDVPQAALRDDQFVRLQQLRKDYQSRGLLATYDTIESLTQQVTLHLTNLVGSLVAASQSHAPDEPRRPLASEGGRSSRGTRDSDDALTMKSPSRLGPVSSSERTLVRKLIEEIEEHFRDSPTAPYSFEPHSTGAGEFGSRVKREVIAQSRKAGWIASDLDEAGGFTVRKPPPVTEDEPVSDEDAVGIDPYAALDPRNPNFIDPYAALDPKNPNFIDPYGGRPRRRRS